MERWGIIYTPKSGVPRTSKRWDKISRLLKEAGVEDYDFVQSEDKGAESRLAAMLAKNGYTTIVVVGSDSALNRAVNGIAQMDETLLEGIRIGLIPNGHANDYATFWGLSESDPAKAIEALCQGRVRKVDLGLMEWEGGKRYFLNCVNIGLGAKVAELKRKTYRFWGMSAMSYATSMLMLLFERMEKSMRLTINHETIDERLMSVCIGNCRGYGQTPNAVPYNGMLDVSVISSPAVSQLFIGMKLLLTSRFLSFRHVRPYRSQQPVKVDNIGGASISVDGLPIKAPEGPFRLSVRTERVNLIIPS